MEGDSDGGEADVRRLAGWAAAVNWQFGDCQLTLGVATTGPVAQWRRHRRAGRFDWFARRSSFAFLFDFC